MPTCNIKTYSTRILQDRQRICIISDISFLFFLVCKTVNTCPCCVPGLYPSYSALYLGIIAQGPLATQGNSQTCLLHVDLFSIDLNALFICPVKIVCSTLSRKTHFFYVEQLKRQNAKIMAPSLQNHNPLCPTSFSLLLINYLKRFS